MVACEPDRADEVLLAMLGNTRNGIEVAVGSDRMQWFGSNLEGTSHPLVFRRDGVPAPNVHIASTTTAP